MKAWFSLLPLLVVASCATNYKSWHGGGIVVGAGGACEQVNGIDIWSMGAPPRPYRVIGGVEDSRPGGVIPMAMRKNAVAREAKARGGDGVIILGEGKEYRGTYNTMNAFTSLNATTNLNATTIFYGRSAYTRGTAYTTGHANTFGSGVSVPIYRALGTYQVIKYVGAEGAGHPVSKKGPRSTPNGTMYLP